MQVMAANQNSAAARCQRAGEHRERGRFAGAVGAQQADGLARAKRDIDGGDASVVARPAGDVFSA